MGPDISPQAARVLDALADNLHSLFFLDAIHGLTEDERVEAAKKAIGVAVAQTGVDAVRETLDGLHPQLREKVATLREALA